MAVLFYLGQLAGSFIQLHTYFLAPTITSPGDTYESPITPGASKTFITSIAAAAGCVVVLLLIIIAAVTIYFKCYKKVWFFQ